MPEIKGPPSLEELQAPEQVRLKQEFIDEHVASNIEFRNRGLHGFHRGSAFLISAMAVLDMEFQKMFGRTTTEQEFVEVARTIHQEREKMFTGKEGLS